MSADLDGSRITILPEGWAAPRGYVNGLVAEGRLLVLAGQIGWDPRTGEMVSDDFSAQVRQTLMNVVALLREAEAEPSQLVRLTWYITDRAAYLAARREIGQCWRELCGASYPTMSVVVVSGLVEARALVEIEATAVLRGP
jgi:enamine deaminase RidA (YjgF/YER057c/UK114 family)